MTDKTDQLGIYVDIGRNGVPRLNFTIGDHTTNVDIDAAGAANLGASLLTSTFLAGMGQEIPAGTVVAPGQLPVAKVEGVLDEATNLPTLKLELIGGATLTFVLSPDVAAIAATSLLHQVQAVTPVAPNEVPSAIRPN